MDVSNATIIIAAIGLIIVSLILAVYIGKAVIDRDQRKLNNIKAVLRDAAYIFVRFAEQAYPEPGSGEQKYKYVAAQLYQRMPTWAKKWITEDDLDDIIESALNRLKAVYKLQEQQQKEAEQNTEHKPEESVDQTNEEKHEPINESVETSSASSDC